MEYSKDILDAIRNEASDVYQSLVPDTSQATLEEIGLAITEYETAFNEFTGLLGKIGKTLITSKSYTNQLAKFKKGELPYGIDIEEIFVEMAVAENSFDPLGQNPLGRRDPEILVRYHRQNRDDSYCKSISKRQVKGAFKSESGVSDLLAKIVNSLYSGAQRAEYEYTKKILAMYEDNYFNYEVDEIVDAATAQAFLRTVRKAVADLSFLSSDYNKAGVVTSTDVQDLVLLVNKDVIAHVDVDRLADAFNLGKTEFEPTVVMVDNFGSMEDTYGLLVDKDFFMIYDVSIDSSEQFNAQGMFTNHFYHVAQILSLSEFKNAVRFTTALPEPEPEPDPGP